MSYQPSAGKKKGNYEEESDPPTLKPWRTGAKAMADKYRTMKKRVTHKE